jgi:hypothetical protein
MLMASTGHSSTQVSQPVHFSTSTTAAMTHLLLVANDASARPPGPLGKHSADEPFTIKSPRARATQVRPKTDSPQWATAALAGPTRGALTQRAGRGLDRYRGTEHREHLTGLGSPALGAIRGLLVGPPMQVGKLPTAGTTAILVDGHSCVSLARFILSEPLQLPSDTSRCKRLHAERFLETVGRPLRRLWPGVW